MNGKALTDTILISYLLHTRNGEDTRGGCIRVKGHCPVCQGNFVEIKKVGFICPTGKPIHILCGKTKVDILIHLMRFIIY